MTSILGTGYQYGDTDFLEYSERIYNEFSKQLRYGSGPVGIGNALLAAKLAYLKQTPAIGDLHEKSLLEAALYGLPMLGVDFSAGRLGTPQGGSGGVNPPGKPRRPPASSGSTCREADAEHPPSRQSKLDVVGAGTLPGPATWYEGADGVYTEPGAPALPLQLENVTPSESNYVLRGVGFRGGTFQESTVVPLSGAPATEAPRPRTPRSTRPSSTRRSPRSASPTTGASSPAATRRACS